MMEFFSKLFSNPVVSGVVAVMISGAVMYMFKSLPMQVGRFLWKRFTITLTVTGDDYAFDWVNSWLSDTEKFTHKARTVKMWSSLRPGQGSPVSPGQEQTSIGGMSPGFGGHLFWEGLSPLFVSRQQSQHVGSDNGSRPRETITITTIGRSKTRIVKIFDKIKETRQRQDCVRIYSCTEWGNWEESLPKSKRGMSSVFLPHEQKQEIIKHAEWFLVNKKWYQERGIPYRLGYLFYGPPGTGKSSMVMALGGYLNLPIYTINPASLNNEACLQRALSNVLSGAIVLIEDIDISSKSFGTQKGKDTASEAGQSIISMSCLLNAIDGVSSSENRILIMTTNSRESLSPILIRPGRIDRQFEIGLMKVEEVENMAMAFFSGNDRLVSTLRTEALENGLKSGAEWQQRCMELQ